MMTSFVTTYHVTTGKEAGTDKVLPTPSTQRLTPETYEGPVCYCSSVAKSCPTLCDPTVRSTPGFPVLHCLLEFAQIHVH